MDGIEAFSEIRRIRKEIPIILCSGYNEQDATQHFAGKGLSGFIHKPFTFENITEKVQVVLRITEQHSQLSNGE